MSIKPVTLSSETLRCVIVCVNNERNRLNWMEQAYDEAINAILPYAATGTRDGEIHRSMIERREDIRDQRSMLNEISRHFADVLADQLKTEYDERTASDWMPETKEDD